MTLVTVWGCLWGHLTHGGSLGPGPFVDEVALLRSRFIPCCAGPVEPFVVFAVHGEAPSHRLLAVVRSGIIVSSPSAALGNPKRSGLAFRSPFRAHERHVWSWHPLPTNRV